MLTNIQPCERLNEVAELKKSAVLSKTIPVSLLEEAKEYGWTEERKPRRAAGRSPKRASTKNALLPVTKPKPYGIEVADRVWSLLYNMGFSHMSNGEMPQLQPGTSMHFRQKLDIDIVSIDSEVGLAVFLQTSPEPRAADTCLIDDLRLYERARHDFSQAINQYKPLHQPDPLKPAFILFNCGLVLNAEEQKVAREKQVVIFNEHDLAYYEDLVERLGTAAKYQFLAEVFEDHEIPGLKIEVPAIKLRAGSKWTYYVFAIRPDLLLKIAFIAHHKPGRQADLTTYQRMANKERLAEMREYIQEAGIYPTNIVISLNPKPDFKRFSDQQKALSLGTYHGELGKLILNNSYKSAWIIDGQHRLFSYSGEERAQTSSIIVIAFEALTPREQTQFFFDINSKQTHIDELHLAQLQSQIYQDASNPAERILSLIPQAIALLERQEDSPFYQRIYFPGQKRSKKRTISSATFNECLLDDIFTKLEYGVLYIKNDDDATIARATFLLKYWFTALKQDVQVWWEAGANQGKGGLATDKGATVCLLVLKQVLFSLIRKHNSLTSFSQQELGKLFQPYASKISLHLASLSDTQRQDFRDKCKTKRGLAQEGSN
jgi:DNA sulfur modification protein DndB